MQRQKMKRAGQVSLGLEVDWMLVLSADWVTPSLGNL